MTIGFVADELKNGNQVQRKTWIKEGKFIYLIEGSTVEYDKLRVDVQEAINTREKIENNGKLGGLRLDGKRSERCINSHIDMMNGDGTITVGYQFTNEDVLAEDWDYVQYIQK